MYMPAGLSNRGPWAALPAQRDELPETGSHAAVTAARSETTVKPIWQ
jgi:hypothetical protein